VILILIVALQLIKSTSKKERKQSSLYQREIKLMTNLTAKKVDNALPRKKEYKLHDGRGLFLRMRPSGAKSWLSSFSLPNDNKLIRMTLDSLKDISLKKARAKLPALHDQVSQGIDPRHTRAAKQTENTSAITMQKLFNDWIEFLKLAGKITPASIKRHEDRWRLHLRKKLGNLLVKDVTRAHLASALDAMARKGIKEETRKALSTLNLMLDYGLTLHFIESNPARIVKTKDFAASANYSRDRVLTLAELRMLWQTIDRTLYLKIKNEYKPAMNPIITTAIKILILTGAPRTEVAAMRWDESNLENGTWLLPAHRRKNKKTHTIHLSKIAINLFNHLKKLTGQSESVFDNSAGRIHSDSLTSAINKLLATYQRTTYAEE
jgi:integrase